MLIINVFVLVTCFDTAPKSKKTAVVVFAGFVALTLILQFIFARTGYSSQIAFYMLILSFFLPFYFTAKGTLAGKLFLFFTQIYIMNVVFYLSVIMPER